MNTVIHKNLRPRKLGKLIQAGFYLIGGLNHFIIPEFYLDLIPRYLVFYDEINILAGLVEVIFGIGLVFKPTRKYAAIGIIMMLIAFIPSHVYFIQIGGCVADGLCAPVWVGWVRLVIVHPLLILWAWSVRR